MPFGNSTVPLSFGAQPPGTESAGVGGKNAPPPPDFSGAAAEQQASSQANVGQQTQANRPNQTTPFGSSQWSQNPDGSWSQNTSFGGALSPLFSGLSQQAGQAMSSPFSLSGVPELTSGQAARDQAINAAYGQATSRLDPQWNQREEAQRTQLLNQGLDPESEAFKSATSQLGQERNDAYSSAMNSAIGQGTQAGQALFGQSLAGRQQGISDLLRQRGQAFGELGQMQGLLGMPGFQAAGAADPLQSLTAALAGGNYGLNAMQANNQTQSDALGGLGSLLGGGLSLAMLLSDERVKINVYRFETEAMPGVPFASWEWSWAPGETHYGVIAQDLQKVAPEYVHEKEGLLMVNYSFLGDKNGTR